MIEILNKADCSGCSACANACPKNAIIMHADSEGFLYPYVDKNKCVDCGACDSMCQAQNPLHQERTPQAYACWNRDEAVRASSSSGGVFRLLAEQVLSEGGIVYGVAMSVDCHKAQFLRVSEVQVIDRLQGSKYVQAGIGDMFRNVKADLKAGRFVLFSGTGCQVNGLKNFLRGKYSNLLCVDVVCHGTPSPALWEKYVDFVEAGHQSKLVNINFRCKDKNWADFGMKITGENMKQVFVSKDVDPYMQMFLRNYSLRPSCYRCSAKKIKQSDLTIGDFWGINEVAPEMNDGKGVSLVLVRTDAGVALFEKVKNCVFCKSVTYEEGVRRNSAEYKSVNRPPERDSFFHDMNKMDFNQLKEKYAAPIIVPVPLIIKIKQNVKNVMKKIGLSGGGTVIRENINNNYGLLFELRNMERECKKT